MDPLVDLFIGPVDPQWPRVELDSGARGAPVHRMQHHGGRRVLGQVFKMPDFELVT